MGCWFSRSAAETKAPPFDIYRNPPLRYVGYAGHLGTACLPLLPPGVANVPQMAATIYIFSDVFQKTLDSVDRGAPKNRVVVTAFDALIWQLLASALIPSLVFNGIKSTSRQLFQKQTKGGPCNGKSIGLPRGGLASRLIPCALALMAAPYMIGPIDRGVDYIMNSTYRKWTKPDEWDLLDPVEKEKLMKQKAKQAAKDAERLAKQKAKEAERMEKEALQKAERAEKERIEKLKQQEREAKELARQKCREEEKIRKEKLAAEEKALKERMKKEEAELKEKQARLEQEFKNKISIKMECD